MELDSERVKRWDRASDAMIETRTIVARIETHVAEINGTVGGLKEESLIQQGMIKVIRAIMAVTLAIISAAGTITGIAVAVAKFGS